MLNAPELIMIFMISFLYHGDIVVYPVPIISMYNWLDTYTRPTISGNYILRRGTIRLYYCSTQGNAVLYSGPNSVAVFVKSLSVIFFSGSKIRAQSGTASCIILLNNFVASAFSKPLKMFALV